MTLDDQATTDRQTQIYDIGSTLTVGQKRTNVYTRIIFLTITRK